MLVKVKAPNDVNGNPQRGWLVSTSSDPTSNATVFVAEGYGGRHDLEAWAADAGVAVPATEVEVEVSVKVFRKLRTQAAWR